MKKADGEKPNSEPAPPIIADILGIVPASRWSFARIESNGDLRLPCDSQAGGGELARLTNELKRQRAKSPRGPRIAATLGAHDGFVSGVTLIFADAQEHYGILVLLRTVELGPFTSSEISMLTLALDVVSERLCPLRRRPRGAEMSPQAEIGDVCASDEGAFYVLDSELRIILTGNSDEQYGSMLGAIPTGTAQRLPRVLEQSVRELTAAWSKEAVNKPGVALPVSFLVVRTRPMSGPTGLFIGVRIDRFQSPNSLAGAASRFHISPREVQVLALLLDGAHLDQIAMQLSITSSTVQDHIKNMLDKTGSRNRSELIARVLGWKSPPTDRRAS